MSRLTRARGLKHLRREGIGNDVGSRLTRARGLKPLGKFFFHHFLLSRLTRARGLKPLGASLHFISRNRLIGLVGRS